MDYDVPPRQLAKLREANDRANKAIKEIQDETNNYYGTIMDAVVESMGLTGVVTLNIAAGTFSLPDAVPGGTVKQPEPNPDQAP